jgi:hypothetical protein
MEAELAKNLLKENKIESIVQKGTFAGFSDAQAADLFVSEKDIEKTKEILETNEQ